VTIDQNALRQARPLHHSWHVIFSTSMHPIGHENHMLREIKVVGVKVRILLVVPSDNQRAVHSVSFLVTCVSVVEVSAFI
jgi:hypothetical protein